MIKKDKEESDITINFTFTEEEFLFFCECFSVLDESFEINMTIEESCMAILLEMKKRRQKRFSMFVYKMVGQLKGVRGKEEDEKDEHK